LILAMAMIHVEGLLECEVVAGVARKASVWTGGAITTALAAIEA
jgi:hypothetical protein